MNKKEKIGVVLAMSMGVLYVSLSPRQTIHNANGNDLKCRDYIHPENIDTLWDNQSRRQ